MNNINEISRLKVGIEVRNVASAWSLKGEIKCSREFSNFRYVVSWNFYSKYILWF